jgi:protein-tyrosine kinase
MERIKLAIEKAKAGDHSAKVASIAPVVAPAVEPEVEEATPEVVVPSPADIRYEKTAVVPLNDAHLEQNRIVAHQKTHPASWAFDVLRTQVLQQMDEKGWRTVAITSPTVDSGKTLMSINLAISIAQQSDRTALLVDFDFRRPRVAASLGLHRTVSLNDVLEGKAELSAALVNPGMERLVVLPTLKPIPKAAEMLSSPKVSQLITNLRDRYQDRTVIFDLPPMLVADDVMAVLPHVDCVLLVVANGASSEKEIEESMMRLSKSNLLGVILNKEESPTQATYY